MQNNLVVFFRSPVYSFNKDLVDELLNFCSGKYQRLTVIFSMQFSNFCLFTLELGLNICSKYMVTSLTPLFIVLYFSVHL